jgi:hypothetical protein
VHGSAGNFSKGQRIAFALFDRFDDEVAYRREDGAPLGQFILGGIAEDRPDGAFEVRDSIGPSGAPSWCGRPAATRWGFGGLRDPDLLAEDQLDEPFTYEDLRARIEAILLRRQGRLDPPVRMTSWSTPDAARSWSATGRCDR